MTASNSSADRGDELPSLPSGPGSWESDPDVVTQQVEGETVIEELQREFGAPPEQIGGEVDKLIANLVEQKLLRPSAR
jgi:hypothetical protein